MCQRLAMDFYRTENYGYTCQRLSTLMDLSKYMTFNELRCGYLVKAEMPTSYK